MSEQFLIHSCIIKQNGRMQSSGTLYKSNFLISLPSFVNSRGGFLHCAFVQTPNNLLKQLQPFAASPRSFKPLNDARRIPKLRRFTCPARASGGLCQAAAMCLSPGPACGSCGAGQGQREGRARPGAAAAGAGRAAGAPREYPGQG